MKRQFRVWASAFAAAALLGCGGDDSDSGNGATVPDDMTGMTGQTGDSATGTGNGGATPGLGGAGSDPAGGAGGTDTGATGSNAGSTGGMAGGTNTGMDGAMGAGGMTPTDDGTAGMNGAGMDTGGTGDDPGTGDDGTDTAATMGSCGPEVTTSAAQLGDPDTLGPFTPMHVERTGPTGASWVYYPAELGMDGMKHPLFQWGPGAGTGPSNYLDHLNLLASHGFVIVSQASTQSGKQALDWMLEENEKEGSMWYQKLDPDRVGRGGHSMGALQSFSEADDPRLKLYVLVCGGANGGSGASNIDDPAIFLGGRGESGTRNFAGDYSETTGLTSFVTHGDTDHIYCARDNLGPWVAFMRWHFCGEEAKWKAEFEPGGTYCTGEWDECMTKNF